MKKKYKGPLKKNLILFISALMSSSLGMVGCTQISTISNSSEVAISNSVQDLYPNIDLEKISSIPLMEKENLKEISTIGNLDEIPVAFEDKGWMIKKDGLYGFIDMDGKVIIEPKYKNILDSSSPTYPNGSIFLYNEDDYSDLIHLPDGSSEAIPGVGADLSPKFFIKGEGTLIGTTSQELQRDKPFTAFLEGTSYEDRPNSDYYIYFPKLEKVEGPFSPKEHISYFQRSEFLPYGSFNISLENFFILPANSSRKETYLIDEKNNQALKGFNSIEPADHQTFTALKDNKAYVFFKDLSTGIGYEAESAARNIGEVVPLKIDGSWKLFQSNS